MARKTSTKAAPAPKAKAAEPKRFPMETLQKNCIQLFGVSSCTFAGVIAGLDKSKKYSIDEMQTLIDEWTKKGVK